MFAGKVFAFFAQGLPPRCETPRRISEYGFSEHLRTKQKRLGSSSAFALRGRGGRFLLECAPSLGRIGLLAGMLCGECSHELGPFVFSPFGGPLAGPAPSDALSLVYRSVFDDQQKVFLRLGQQFDILQRVAVDEQQIGQGVRLDRSERARIGIPAARQGEQLRVVAGYHFQYFVVREPAGQLGDSSVLVLGFGRVEQQVGSPREPDAVLFASLYVLSVPATIVSCLRCCSSFG